MTRNKLDLEDNKALNFKDDIAAFVHYFSFLDSKGLASVLRDNVLYDEQSKKDWITLFEKQFETFRNNNFNRLKSIPGMCSGCKKGCSGYTFLDEINGFYVDLAIEVTEHGNIDFTDCVHLKNELDADNKKEQIFINDKDLYNDINTIPF